MYYATNQQPMKLKSGETIPVNSECLVTVTREKPYMAIITVNGKEIRTASTTLYRYFNDFIQPTEELIVEAMTDGVCQSLLGNDVEPDGYDEHGFPSILMACGVH